MRVYVLCVFKGVISCNNDSLRQQQVVGKRSDLARQEEKRKKERNMPTSLARQLTEQTLV
jgi:hypothetical protein